MTVQTQAQTLDQMRADVYECNEANGWFDDSRDFLDDVALLHSEVSEMFEAYRDGGFGDATVTQRAVRGVGIDFVDDSKTTYEPIENPKPLGFGSECADVLVRLLDTSFRTGVEFGWKALAEVPASSDFAPTLTVGGHISNLHRLITKIDLSLADQFAGASLDPTLAYLVTWCRDLGIDLQGEFDRKLAFNRTRGHKHGGKLL